MYSFQAKILSIRKCFVALEAVLDWLAATDGHDRPLEIIEPASFVNQYCRWNFRIFGRADFVVVSHSVETLFRGMMNRNSFIKVDLQKTERLFLEMCSIVESQANIVEAEHVEAGSIHTFLELSDTPPLGLSSVKELLSRNPALTLTHQMQNLRHSHLVYAEIETKQLIDYVKE